MRTSIPGCAWYCLEGALERVYPSLDDLDGSFQLFVNAAASECTAERAPLTFCASMGPLDHGCKLPINFSYYLYHNSHTFHCYKS